MVGYVGPALYEDPFLYFIREIFYAGRVCWFRGKIHKFWRGYLLNASLRRKRRETKVMVFKVEEMVMG